MNTVRRQITSLKNLSPLEIVVITNALSIIEGLEKLEKRVIELVNENKFVEAKEALIQLSYFKHTPAFLVEMKKQVLEYCTNETLLKIINNVPFEENHSWSDKKYIISSKILPEISSYDKVNISNPKAEIYKKLGATIIA